MPMTRTAKILALLALVLGAPLMAADSSRAQQPASFGEWGLACQALGPSETRCALFQRAVRENNALVMEAQVLGLEDGGEPALAVTTPLSVWLPAGVTITIDGGTPKRQEFQTCAARGCIARLEEPGVLELLDAGNEMEVSYATGPDPAQSVTLTLSLIGVGEGVAAIQDAAKKN